MTVPTVRVTRHQSRLRVVDAIQLTDDNLSEALDFVGDAMTAAGNRLSEQGVHVAYRTTQGGHVHAKPGDWIVRNEQGEFEWFPDRDFREYFSPLADAAGIADPVVVSRADLVAYLNRGTGDVAREAAALNRLLAVAGIE